MKKAFGTILSLFFAFLVIGQESQNVEIGNLSSGSYTVYKTVEKSRNDYDLDKVSKPWPVEFTMDGEVCSEILIKRAGIIDEKYEADLLKFPAYYFNSSSEVVISVIDSKIYYYKWSIKTGAEIVYILTEKGVSSYEKEKAALDEYRRKILDLQKNAREERSEEREEIAAEEAAQNSLEGKDIKSINVVFVDQPEDIGHLTIVQIGMEVELTDGTVLKTKNLGGKTPYSDFEFVVSGGDYAGGDFKVAADSRDIPNDRIEVSAKSKFGNSSITGKLSHPINYKSEIFYQYQGRSGQFGRASTVGYSKHGGDGSNGRSVNVMVELKTINGFSVNEITVTDAQSGELLTQAKLNVDSPVTFNVNGGNGGSGASGDYAHDHNGGNGGNGGDAGYVTLMGSGADLIQITVLSNGGRGGAGGKGKTSYDMNGTNGSSGSDGGLIK